MYSLKKYAGLGTVASINLVLQFVFQWYIIVFFGAGTQTDVFFGTMVLPQFILLILSSSLTMVLMPMIAKSDQDEFATEAWSYFLGVGLLFAGIVIVLVLTAGYWVAWILPGFRSADHTLAVNLARIQSVSMFFTALLSVVWSIQGAKNNFVLIEKSSIIANSLALLLLIFTIKRFGIYAAAWISVIRVLLQVLFLMKVMGPYPGFHFRTVSFKQAWKKLRPLVAGNMYYKTDMLADRYLTSLGSRGELTLLNLAQQLYSVGNTILVKVFVNTMIPEMARATAANDVERYNQLLKKRLLLSFVSSVFVLITIVFAGKWALGYFFSFKNFTVADV